MRRRVVCSAVTTMLAATGMLVGLGGATPALAVGNGTPVNTAPAWAAYVTKVTKFLGIQGFEGSCTGTIISNQWVLTAAHCVMTEDKNGNPTNTRLPLSKFEVVLGRSDLSKTRQGAQWTVDKVAVHPGWKPSAIVDDVALLHLKGALPSNAKPLAIAPSGFRLSDGQAVQSYGYGDVKETYSKSAIAAKNFSKYTGTTSKVLRLTQAGSYKQSSSCSNAADCAWFTAVHPKFCTATAAGRGC